MTKRHRQDLYRTMAFIVLATLLYVIDATNLVVIQAFLIGTFLALGSHITRRILFPSLDLQEIARRAWQDNSMAAAVVFVGICLVLLGVMHLGFGVLK